MRGEGARPKYWHQIRSQRKEWKPIIFYIYIYIFFGGENHTFFLDTLSPYFLFSLERLTVSGIRKLLGEEDFSRAPSWPLDLQFRQALAAGGLACELGILLGPQGTKGIRDQGPSCCSMIPGLALLPHFYLFLTLRTFGTQWNHHFKAKMN